jgi:transcriptional regulator NrdR family protein
MAIQVNCPTCGEKTKVIETRVIAEDPDVYRRRACSNCGSFVTREFRVSTASLWVETHRSLRARAVREAAE